MHPKAFTGHIIIILPDFYSPRPPLLFTLSLQRYCLEHIKLKHSQKWVLLKDSKMYNTIIIQHKRSCDSLRNIYFYFPPKKNTYLIPIPNIIKPCQTPLLYYIILYYSPVSDGNTRRSDWMSCSVSTMCVCLCVQATIYDDDATQCLCYVL